MLHRTMSVDPISILLRLDDVLGDLQHARRTSDIGRMALVTYCEVRRWARQAGEAELAERSWALLAENPHATRGEFLRRVDELIVELERARDRLH
jgi:hypothetical protein